MGRTKKEDTTKAVINIGVRKDGRVIVDTTEEFIPTKYVQEILDQVISKIYNDKIEKLDSKDLLFKLKEAEKECKIWKYIAYGQIIILIIILLITVL